MTSVCGFWQKGRKGGKNYYRPLKKMLTVTYAECPITRGPKMTNSQELTMSRFKASHHDRELAAALAWDAFATDYPRMVKPDVRSEWFAGGRWHVEYLVYPEV